MKKHSSGSISTEHNHVRRGMVSSRLTLLANVSIERQGVVYGIGASPEKIAIARQKAVQ
jgi:hypothetical protein